jgi:hypothetical protein
MLVPGVLSAAQQWPAMHKLALLLAPDRMQLQPGTSLNYCVSGVVGAARGLQQVRSMRLTVPAFGTSCAQHFSGLQQLTALELAVTHAAADIAAADLSALSCMTNLVNLQICNAPAVQPAAGPTGPFSLPGCLRHLSIYCMPSLDASGNASWAAHLPACRGLEEVHLVYEQQQQPADFLDGVVQLLGQHCQQLRTLRLVPRDVLLDVQWHPAASLAGLAGLQQLEVGNQLCVESHADWQHLAQLTDLSELCKMTVSCAPLGVSMAGLVTLECEVALGGYDLGCLLLACPALRVAKLEATALPHPVPAMPAGAGLTAHPQLRSLGFDTWRGCVAATAVAEFACLAPVLSGVAVVRLSYWPCSSSSSRVGSTLPDLSPCTAITSLIFHCAAAGSSPWVGPQQEDLLSMVTPLVQLQRLEVQCAQWLNARVVLLLQTMLPQLQHVRLWCCGSILVQAVGDPEVPPGAEQQALFKVQQLLRPGLALVVEEQSSLQELLRTLSPLLPP